MHLVAIDNGIPLLNLNRVDPTSIALVVGSGALVSSFVSSAFHVHGIMLYLIVSFSLGKLCSDYIV